MAKKTSSVKAEMVSLIPENVNNPRPRLSKLVIKNFRTIGNNPVEIDLDARYHSK